MLSLGQLLLVLGQERAEKIEEARLSPPNGFPKRGSADAGLSGPPGFWSKTRFEIAKPPAPLGTGALAFGSRSAWMAGA